MIVGVVGMPGSGKTETAAILKRKKFYIFEMSSVVKDDMTKKGIPLTNVNIREYATGIRKKYGKDVVAKETVKRVKKIAGGKRNVAIIGIRSMEEIKLFKKGFGKIDIISITAPAKLRFGRMHARHRTDDPKTVKEFEYREGKELGWGLAKAIANGDYVISNTGTRKELVNGIGEIIKTLKTK